MDVLQIENEGYCRGVENYARHLAGRKTGEPPDCLIDLTTQHMTVIDHQYVLKQPFGFGATAARFRSQQMQSINNE